VHRYKPFKLQLRVIFSKLSRWRDILYQMQQLNPYYIFTCYLVLQVILLHVIILHVAMWNVKY